MLQKCPRELRDQIYTETIEYGIVIEYTPGPDPNNPHHLHISHVPTEATTPLIKIDAFHQEVEERYDTDVAKLRSAIHGQQINASPEVSRILKTSRFELNTTAKVSMAWLSKVSPVIGSRIRCLRIGEANVIGTASGRTWWSSPGRPGFPDMIKDSCPALEEIVLWMPDERMDSYSIQAPKALCNLLEEGHIDRLLFLLDNFDPAEFEDHPILDNLLRMEEMDVEEFEECYEGDNFLRDFSNEVSRIKGLGDRFHCSNQPPRRWDTKRFNSTWPEHVVYTYRRMTEADYKRNERIRKMMCGELDDYVEDEFD